LNFIIKNLIRFNPISTLFRPYFDPRDLGADHFDFGVLISVLCIVETKEVHCTATYGRKSKKFQWTVTRGQITLSALKSRLRTCFTFPDGTEDEHIVINRECGGNEKEIICLVDDEDLASVIWTQGFKVDFPIVVDTCKYRFAKRLLAIFF